MLMAGYFSYYLIRNEVRDGTDETLVRERNNVESVLKLNQKDQLIYLSADSVSSVQPMASKGEGVIFSDSVIFDKAESENINYRILRSHYSCEGRNYLITIAKPSFEEDELIEGLLTAFGLIITFLVLAFFLVNWILSKTLWKPFYKTLNELNNYDIRKHEQHSFEPASTLEFSQLNHALNKMTDKINSDYLLQKEFTENASHEMQTPLAVAKANISLLIQSPILREEEMNYVQAIDNTLRKLSSLNKTLILLTKIENHQFDNVSQIDLKERVNKTLENFNDLIQSRNLKMELNLNSSFKAEMDSTLADVLISNLIQNAIRHNYEGGKITVNLIDKVLSISNTGEPLKVNEEDLFVRFKKNDASAESLGLGLSIVKSIADNYGVKLSYNYNNQEHTFILKFI